MIETFLCILESLLPSVFAMGEKNNKKNVSLKLQLVERPRRAYGRLAYKSQTINQPINLSAESVIKRSTLSID
jgi:hypothetical protein